MTVEITLTTHDGRRYFMSLRYRPDRDGYFRVAIYFVYAAPDRRNRLTEAFTVYLPGHLLCRCPIVIS
jgi:hypothetical protein